MSGARERTALEDTGARLGDALRRALRDRLARRRDGVSLAAGRRQDMDERGMLGMHMVGVMDEDTPVRDRGDIT
jgi:hypothetical protein